ncbi:MAG: PH domain-containing protein [Ramlibacter sp.]
MNVNQSTGADEQSEEIRRELSPGEQVRWSGRPRQGIAFRGSDALGIPFSLLWCGFAIFWEHGVVTSNAPAFFTLWGIPFVLVGLYMVIGRFFFDARQRARTYYAVTSERVLIVSGVLSRKVKSLNLNTLTDISLTETRGGEGDITFGPQSPFPSLFGNSGWPGTQQQSPKFEFVSNAKSVYEKIRGAQRSSFSS